MPSTETPEALERAPFIHNQNKGEIDEALYYL